MDDTGSEQPGVRQRQLRYEDRTEQLRQHIDGLIQAYAGLGNDLINLQPKITDDLDLLDDLDTDVRNNITQLLPLISRYEQVVDEWDQWDANYYVRTEDTPWTRKVFRLRSMYFRGVHHNPPFPEQVQQLIEEYNDTVKAIQACRDVLHAQAKAHAAINAARSPRSTAPEASSTASTQISEAAHTAATENSETRHRTSEGSGTAHSAVPETEERQVRFAESPHSGDSASSLRITTAGVSATNASISAQPTTPLHFALVLNYLARQCASVMQISSTPAQPVQASITNQARSDVTPTPAPVQRPHPKPRTVQPPPTRTTSSPTPPPRHNRVPFHGRPTMRPPIVTQLDHGDDSTLSPASAYGGRDFTGTWYPDDDLPPEGLMNYADGDIRDTRPIVWDNSPGAFGLYSDFNAPRTAPAQPRAAPGGPMPHSGYGTTAAPHSSAAPGGPMPHSGYGAPDFMDVPTSRMPPAATTSRAPPLHSAPDHTHAAERTSFDTPPLSTPPISDKPASSATAATCGTATQSTSSFYSKASYTRRTFQGTTSVPLVLKEIPIPTFDGDIRDYPLFRNRFLEVVESQPGLDGSRKLQYLLQYLKGEPLQLADGFPINEESYWIVTELLEQRYGNERQIVKRLRQDLLDLPTCPERRADLLKFHDAAFKAVKVLTTLGKNVKETDFYSEIIIRKLPESIRRPIILYPGFQPDQHVTLLLEALRKELAVMEEVSEAGLRIGGAPPKQTQSGRAGQTTHNVGPPQHPNYTFAAVTEGTSAARRDKRKMKCAYCGQLHFSGRCNIYRTIEQRLKRLRQLNYCLLCLRPGHWSDACPYRTRATCNYCANTHPHHVSLCREYVFRRPGRPSNAPVSQPSPRGGSEATRSSQPTSQTVNCQGNRNEPAAKNVRFSSAPSSPPDNSKDNRKKQSGKKKKNKGTPPSGRGGTPRPTTASAAESTSQHDVQAWDGPGLLPGHQSMLQTDRCPNPHESAQCADDNARRQQEDEQAWLASLRACEEVSTVDSIGHCSEADIFDLGSECEDGPEYPDNSGYAVSASTPADTRAVLLECARATAVNPRTGASREVTVFFDSGSISSYCSTNLARDLDLPQLEKRTLQVNTFAATTATILEGFSTSLVLRTPGGRSISLDTTAADNIVQSVRTAFVTDAEVPQLRQNKCALISTRETPDLLIGQDLEKIFERSRQKRLPNGCYVVHTILGPMVGGAGQVTTMVPRDAPTSNVADTGSRAGTLCPPGTDAFIDILDRSSHRPRAPASSTTGHYRSQTSTSVPTHPVSPDVSSRVGTHSVPADGPPPEAVSSYACGLAEKSDAELLGDFSYLENAGIGTDEMKPDDEAAAEMLQSMRQREPNGRFKVPLLFRTSTGAPPTNEELPTNAALGKGRAISTRNSLIKVPEKLKTYDGIIKDYEQREFIGRAPRFTPYPKHCLSHHPVFKDSTTTSTRPVFDASAKLPGRTCLNDWVFRGPVLLPVVPAILLRSRFPIIIIVCDIGKAFLQISVMESHRDCLRFFWFKDPFAEPTDDNIIEYRFNRVPFGLKSSPYLLAGVIKMHLEQEGTPLALEMLKNCYVDNVLLMADNVKEALQKYRDSKATFAKIQMPLREYASNNAQFNNAVDPADRAELSKLRELGIRWDVTADYWDLPLMPKPASVPTHPVGKDTVTTATEPTGVPAHSAGTPGPVHTKKVKRNRGKKSDDGRLTKRSMLRFVAYIFDPLGLVQAAILLAKLVIQELWKIEIDWDDDVPPQLAQLWLEAIKDFDRTTIRIPRRIAKGKITSAELHIFTDGSSQAYGFTAYLRVPEEDGSFSSNLVYSRAKVKPIKDAEKYTIPRMELLGVLVGARAAKFLYQEVSVDITAVYLWSDSTIVLHQVAETEKIKEVFVENRLKEIRQIRDQLEIQFRHVPTDDNPADIVSRGIPAAELQHCTKWWFGASFLAYDKCHWPQQPASLGAGTHPVPEPHQGLEPIGSDTFAALYAEVFTPPEHVTNRRFRPRKKKNPLDTITKPLPSTTVSAYAIAALGKATRSVARPKKLSSTSVLPAATEEKYPVWSRQVRLTYYVVRFAAACLRRLRQTPRQSPRQFTAALGFDITEHFKSSKPNLRDLNLTETIILRKIQLRHPPVDTDRRNLGIFEYQGLLYVKGRLGNMKLRPTALTPLYLPREAKETELIIADYHRNHCHSGVTATLANIRMRYWFTHGRRTIRKAIYKKCFPCRREALHPYASPPWPQLPVFRVTRSRPFLFTGLDFFGPCYLRNRQSDGTFEVEKHYVAIFVCMTYRCVHLELCSDLSTQEFLHALRRFGCKREYPERVLSDNGTSFLTAREVIYQVHRSTAPSRPVIRRNPVRQAVSARLAARRTSAHTAGGLRSTTTLPHNGNDTPGTAHTADPGSDRSVHALLTPEEEQLVDFCQRHKIEWQTITELSPWRGGAYERLIGLIKHCLRRSIGRTKPTVTEFSSLLAEAEHTANSRPLSYVADSETDFFLVRPLDFIHPLLRDEALQGPLDPPVDAEADPNDSDFIAPGDNQLHGKIIKDLKRARLQADLLWTQFRDGYLAELRSRGVNRKRRQYGEPDINVGDLVLVWEPNVPRCFWRFALVLELLPCDDGEIRSARVRFSKTHQEHTRSLAHLYPIGNQPRVPAPCTTTAFAGSKTPPFVVGPRADLDQTAHGSAPQRKGRAATTTTAEHRPQEPRSDA